MSETNLRHIIITRFNCRFGEVAKHLSIAPPTSPSWLDERFDLFERFCAPTLLNQTTKDFDWFVYFDRDTPRKYLDKAADAMEHQPRMHVKLCDAFTIEMLKQDIDEAVGQNCTHLLTTRLDNDDGVRSDFVERLHKEVRSGKREALNFPFGLVFGSDRLYRSMQASNAFISVSEPYDSNLLTVHCGSHNAMPSLVEVRDIGSADPAWLQVVHGGNVSNKLRGRRVQFRQSHFGFVPLEEMASRGGQSESSIRIAIENASISVFWAVRDWAAKIYRKLRR